MTPVALTTAWSFEDNARLFHALSQEQRDANLQSATPLTGNFSVDYPAVCCAFNIELHPTLIPHIQPFQPIPKPPTPLTAPAEPVVDNPAVADILSSPPLSARPAASPSTAAGKKADAKKKEKPEKVVKPPTKAVVVKQPEPAVVPVERDTGPQDERSSLALTQCKIDIGTVAAIAACLAVNRHITRLRIQHAAMSDEAVGQLCQLVGRSCVQFLYLSYITTVPVEPTTVSAAPSAHPLLAVVGALSGSAVQLLSLQGMRLEDEDGAVIAASLTDNTTLQSLDLSNNRLSHRTSTALTTALLSNTILLHLSLALNPISSTALSSLLLTAFLPGPAAAGVTAAQAKKGQQAGGVRYNSSTRRGVYRECNSTLVSLDVSWCEAGDSVVETVTKVVQAGAAVGADSGEDGAGWRNALRSIRCGGNGESEAGWTALKALGEVVSVEDSWQPRYLHATPSSSPAATSAPEQQPALPMMSPRAVVHAT